MQELLQENSGDIESAIGVILEVEDVKGATDESQRVAELAEDADFEDAAQFDIFSYL